MHELSLVLHVCRFCHFSIYISVRFVYISVTLSFRSLFLFLLAKIPVMPFLPCHLCHLWHLIVFKRFFLAKTLAKTCHPCHKNGKSLILKEFLFVKCGTSLFCSALLQCNATIYNNATIYSNATMLRAMQCYYIKLFNTLK